MVILKILREGRVVLLDRKLLEILISFTIYAISIVCIIAIFSKFNIAAKIDIIRERANIYDEYLD